MKRSFLALLIGSVFLIGSRQVSAAVIFSNFGPADSFNAGPGYSLDPFPGGQSGVAMPFTVTGGSNYTFTSVEVALDYDFGGSLNILLMSNSAGVPGGVIESFTVSSFSNAASIKTATSTVFPTLVDGTSYWIATRVFQQPVGFAGRWMFNDRGITGLVAFSRNEGASWFPLNAGLTTSAFRVNGNGSAVVPEPGSLTLLGVGLLSLGAWRKRRVAA